MEIWHWLLIIAAAMVYAIVMMIVLFRAWQDAQIAQAFGWPADGFLVCLFVAVLWPVFVVGGLLWAGGEWLIEKVRK